MMFTRSLCVLCCCLVIINHKYVFVSSQSFMFSSPNSDEWQNPDDFFPEGSSHKSESEKISNENVEEYSDKHPQSDKRSQIATIVETDHKKGESHYMPATRPMSMGQDEQNGAKAYLQRFIHLLLEVSNLDKGDVETVNKAELKFYISDDQLKTLRQFSKEGNIKSVPLRKVDEILATVLVKPFINLPTLESLGNKIPDIKIGSFFISVLLPALWFLSILWITKSVWQSFKWFVPITFLTSYLTTAHRMFEEAQLKQYEEMKKYPDIPQDCYKTSGFLFGGSGGKSDCSKYLKAHRIDPNLHITTTKVLSEMFGVFISDVMKHFGDGLQHFYDAFSELSFVQKLAILPAASVVLISFGVLTSLVLTGGSIRLPWFLGSLNFWSSTAEAGPSYSYGQNSARPAVSNITVNFHNLLPRNVKEVMQSLHQFNTSESTENTHQQQSISSASHTQEALTQSQVGAGDGLQDIHGGGSGSASHRGHSRPTFSINSKKGHKPFSNLEARYKAGSKSSGKQTARQRHISL